MNTQLRFLSISHKSASVSCRERFCLTGEEKLQLSHRLQEQFEDLQGLFFLFTCNRAEVYFETKTTPSEAVLEAFLDFKLGKVEHWEQGRFSLSDSTARTTAHLLRVSAGLESAVLGDAEIIHQIRKSWQDSLERNLQGSLLERAIQTVFRTHKRIHNETAYRDGTTSTAYKALKMIGTTFSGQQAREKHILFVGAGDIIRQVFAYNAKFEYRNIWVTNRSAEKAEALAEQHGVHTFPWASLEENELESFDVIISAVSARQSLIRSGISTERETLLIDLAVPGNIDPNLGKHPHVKWYDLDAISRQLEQTQARRAAAVRQVEEFVQCEGAGFLDWLQEAPKREALARRKAQVLASIRNQYKGRATEAIKAEWIALADRIVRKLLKHPEALNTKDGLDQLVRRYGPMALAS